LSLGLQYLKFNDAIREGGYVALVLVYKATNHPNYSTEAFSLLAQEEFILTPWMALQLKWNHTVNK